MRISSSMAPISAFCIANTAIKSGIGAANLAKTVSSLALPTIAMTAVSKLPQAFAKRHREEHISAPDPNMAYVHCMNACDKIPDDGFKLSCYTSCWLIDKSR